jgi:hypothetical protein
VLAGLAGLPSAALRAGLSRTWSGPTLLIAALTVQGVGITLPAVAGGAGAALVSAVLFGGTFLGVAALVLAIGEHLRRPGAVAILTTGYSARDRSQDPFWSPRCCTTVIASRLRSPPSSSCWPRVRPGRSATGSRTRDELFHCPADRGGPDGLVHVEVVVCAG